MHYALFQQRNSTKFQNCSNVIRQTFYVKPEKNVSTGWANVLSFQRVSFTMPFGQGLRSSPVYVLVFYCCLGGGQHRLLIKLHTLQELSVTLD